MATGQALQHQAGFERVAGHHGTDEAVLSECHSFTVVRNHWDALVSWHCGGHGDPGMLTTDRLRKVVHDLGGYLPNPTRLWGLHAPVADWVMRYESLEAGINRVLNGFGLPSVEIPEHNVSTSRQGRPHHDFYTDPAREWVRHRFFREIGEFGYTF